MNESQWDNKLREFLKKTGEDLKRAGGDIKGEAEKLMKEVKDPERQEKVKKGLESFRLWARKTAEEVAAVVETGVKKAEGAVRSAADKATHPNAPSPDDGGAAPHVEPQRSDTPVDTPAVSAPADAPDEPDEPAPSKKTIGASKKKVAPKTRGGGSKKPLGKKRTP